MSKGYFDDFKQLRDTEGRVVSAPDRLIAAQAAPSFPDIQVWLLAARHVRDDTMCECPQSVQS